MSITGYISEDQMDSWSEEVMEWSDEKKIELA